MTARDGRWIALAAILVLLVMALALRWMGRPLWCGCGEAFLWSGEVWSRHNSQHLVDPYTLTHVSHGILFLLVARRLSHRRGGGTWGLLAALVLEAAWEAFENTDFVIRRYREATISLDYYGDSVANSVADVLAMAVGYVACMRIPTRWCVGAFVMLEVGLALWIRDGLVLNVLMLLWPLESVRVWQTGG